MHLKPHILYKINTYKQMLTLVSYIYAYVNKIYITNLFFFDYLCKFHLCKYIFKFNIFLFRYRRSVKYREIF